MLKLQEIIVHKANDRWQNGATTFSTMTLGLMAMVDGRTIALSIRTLNITHSMITLRVKTISITHSIMTLRIRTIIITQSRKALSIRILSIKTLDLQTLSIKSHRI